MAKSRYVAVVGTIVMALGTVSCGASDTNSASQSTTTACSTLTCDQTRFQAIAKDDPTNKYAPYDLGVIAQGRGNRAEAQTDFLRAIAIDPKFEAPLYQEGFLRFHANDIQGAISYLRRAVRSNPQDANAHWVFGIALSRESRAKSVQAEASAQLHDALTFDPALVKNAQQEGLPACNRCRL